ENGRCIDRERNCIPDTYAKGDHMCQYICIGGYWACPIDARVCGGGPQLCVPNWPRDTSADTCVGHCVKQDDGCGNTRIIRGTSTAPSHQCMQNYMGPGADCI